ncbi:MAG: UDP-N-acetylmuramoyl-tripeptide--D-alanyl-D-alanine ligase [Candidatus Paceibacterota bacterium]|jgi:UDP-N-acetylmuramoyl-tripeptide--D-alanyl-D-alanine ligase
MKNLLKSIVAFKLGLCARIVVHRYHPHIVMVTGSVGKTSTKDAVAAVLAARFFVRKSKGNLNTEFGVPLTIFGVDVPDSLFNPFAWLKVAKNALALILLPNHYPNMLVLETGADKPGDLARILRLATPDMVVVTRLPEIPVHVEAYVSPEAVREEEFSPAYALAGGAPLIIPSDDPYVFDCTKRTPARCISYGTTSDADVSIKSVDFYEIEGKVTGMQASVVVDGKKGSLVIEGSVGKIQLLPVAAALAAALAYEIPLKEALEALEAYEPPPGRGRLLDGKNESIIIDDSYNSSPAAVEEALSTLKAFPHAKRRVAVLGDMLELGRYSVIEHERIATQVNESADVIVAVGIRARAFISAAKNAEVLLFDNSRAAAEALPSLIHEGDVILVKGSQSIRMERVVESLLANPVDSVKLVRQEKKWRQKA